MLECGRAAPDPEPCPVLKEELEAIEEGVTEQEEEEVAPLPLKDVPELEDEPGGIAEQEAPPALDDDPTDDEAVSSLNPDVELIAEAI